MSRREVLLLALVVAAALAAAFSFHVAAHPGELHDPDYEARFEAAKKALPLLGAVRVRTDAKHAAHRLRISARDGIVRVVDPARAVRAFRDGRLLYGTKDEVRAVRDALRRNELPPSLPEMPEVARVFVDRRGPYACDVIVDSPVGLDAIRSVVPCADLSGEPVLRVKERAAVRDVPRGLIVCLVLVYAWCRVLNRKAERRLVAALLGLAALGGLGWGVDGTTVLAIAIAAGAPRGPVLLCGAPLLLFPPMALKRMGLVFLVAAIARWRAPGPPASGRRPQGRAAWIAVAVLTGVTALAFSEYRPRHIDSLFVRPFTPEPAAAFVERDAVVARAAELRKSGLEDLVGDNDPIPPAADLVTRRMLNQIFRRASDLARTDERFAEVRDAAAVDRLDWPADLRARLHTTDRRAVLWTQDEVLDREEFNGSELYRRRGAAGLNRDGRIATVLLLLVIAAVSARRIGTVVPVVAHFIPALVWSALEGSVLTLPLLAMTSVAPSGAVVLAMCGAMATMPTAYLFPSLALALASAFAWGLSRLRRGPAPPARTGPDRPALSEGS